MGTQSQTSAPTPSSSNRHHHNGSNCPTPILLHPGRGGGSSRAAHPHRGGRRKHPVLVGGLPGREPQPVVHRLRHLHSGDPHVHGHRSARSHLLRRRFMNQLAKLWNEYPRFRLVTKTIMFIIGGFFLDALRQVYMLYDATSVYGTTSGQVPGASGYTLNKDAYLGFYKAERNAYLCGTTSTPSLPLDIGSNGRLSGTWWGSPRRRWWHSLPFLHALPLRPHDGHAHAPREQAREPREHFDHPLPHREADQGRRRPAHQEQDQVIAAVGDVRSGKRHIASNNK